MPICGFNQKMLAGLEDMSEGISKSKQSVTIKETLRLLKEKDDLYYDKLRPELGPEAGIVEWVKSFQGEPINPLVIRGVTKFAKGLYEQAQIMAKKFGTSLEESYNNEMKEMSIALKTMEEVFGL